MTHIQFDYKKALAFFGEHELEQTHEAVKIYIMLYMIKLVQVVTF